PLRSRSSVTLWGQIVPLMLYTHISIHVPCLFSTLFLCSCSRCFICVDPPQKYLAHCLRHFQIRREPATGIAQHASAQNETYQTTAERLYDDLLATLQAYPASGTLDGQIRAKKIEERLERSENKSCFFLIEEGFRQNDTESVHQLLIFNQIEETSRQ